MRIVITHTDFRLYWPARIRALQQDLEAAGDELYIVEIAGKGSPYAFAGHPADMHNWICLFPTSRMEDISSARASRRLRQQLSALHPDVIISGSIAFPSGATAVYWAKTNNKPVIMFDDVRPGDVPRNALVNYIKRLLYRQVDAVLCPAPGWTDAFRHWDFCAEQLFFGVDVVDNEWWAAPAKDDTPPHLWDEWPTPYFLSVGRMIPAKNFLFLLQTYAKYRTMTREPLPLVIIGDGPARNTLETFIRDKEVDGVYLLPFLPAEQLRACYQHAAALALPSISETWGLVVNEAMASGLPVLVSSACGCADVLVQEGINGYTFLPDKEDTLLALLLQISGQDESARAAMGKVSQRVVQAWGLDQFVKGCQGAIKYALAHRKPCRSIKARFVLQHWKGRYRPV